MHSRLTPRPDCRQIYSVSFSVDTTKSSIAAQILPHKSQQVSQMETLQDNWRGNGRKAVKPLDVIIVGAGIGGLTAGIALAQTGHVVQILESASTIEDVGAGIQ